VPQTETEAGVSTGTTDENGEYKLTVFKTGSRGAVVGTHKVWVSLPRTPPEAFENENKKKAPRTPGSQVSPDIAQILWKYGKLDTTPLTVEVTGDPIDLKLD
jgi:hypothetical protein